MADSRSVETPLADQVMSHHEASRGRAGGRSEPAARDLALAVVARGSSSPLELPGDPVRDAIFFRLLGLAKYDRLVGAMAEALAAGDLPATDRQREALVAEHTAWLHHGLMVERLLLEVGDVFGESELEFRVLKGVALAHLVYGDPAWRVFGDLDILVPSHRFDDAVRLSVTQLGGAQQSPELRPGFDREFGKESLVRVGRIELDLHRTFVAGPFGLTIDLDRLFESSTTIEIGGRELAVLDPPAIFLHACYNLALGDHPVRLGSLRDIVQICAVYDIDAGDMADLAASWRATAVVERAARLATRDLRLEDDHPLARLSRLEVPNREARLLHSYLGSARSYQRALASLAVIPGVGPKLRYARALAQPSSAYRASRGWSPGTQWRRFAEGILRRG